jgi:exonuclease VII small subunit
MDDKLILEARIEEYKKTVKDQEREIDVLEANINLLKRQLEIYKESQVTLNKVLDRVGSY